MIPGWTVHSKAVLLGTPIYFFTCFFGEHLIYFLVPKINNSAVKDFANVVIVLCTGLLLLIEVFLSLIIAEKILKKTKKNDEDEFIEDIIGDGYLSIDQNSHPDLHHSSHTFSSKQTMGKSAYPSSSSLLTHEQFLKTGIATEHEQYESIKSFEKIDADINVDIGGNIITDKKTELINSLVVIEDGDRKLDEAEQSLQTDSEPELPEPLESVQDEDIALNEAETDAEEIDPDIDEENNTDETDNLDEADDLDVRADFEAEDDLDVVSDLESEDDLDIETDIEAENDLEAEYPAPIEISAAQPLQPRPQEKIKGYHIPYDLLVKYPGNEYWLIDDSTKAAAIALKNTFAEFSIDIEITGIRKGPVVTMFEVLPPPGIKLGKITALQDNIALRLAAQSVRIVAPIPGKQAVGIEVPNRDRSIVGFRELIETEIPETKKMGIPVVLGKDVTGEPQTLDLCQTPHLLIAGATGSGKSVCVNSIILSILYNKTPEEVKLLLVDPKIVELKLYNGIGHLLTPVITEPKKALQGLQYCICEMERRYAMLDGMSVRDIKSYNKKIRREKLAAETLPYIVIIIDEFADLMATTGKELEATVSRLCAMSRAVGIHLVLATQRPSTNVITGLIKANIPSRIAFMVASRIDSQIILDNNGAEKLLGRGDMLYISTTKPFPARIQGTFVSADEVEQVVECVKTFGEPDYIDDEIFIDDEEYTQGTLFNEESDPLYDEALEIVMAEGKASASYIQRKLKIGYNRAARIVEEMEARGVVGPANGSKPREVINQP